MLNNNYKVYNKSLIKLSKNTEKTCWILNDLIIDIDDDFTTSKVETPCRGQTLIRNIASKRCYIPYVKGSINIRPVSMSIMF